MDICFFGPGRQPNTQPVLFLSDLITWVSVGNRSIHTFHYGNWKKPEKIPWPYLWQPEHAHLISAPPLGYSCLGTWPLRKSCGAMSFEPGMVKVAACCWLPDPLTSCLHFKLTPLLCEHLYDFINLTYALPSQSSFLLLATKNVDQRKR